MHVPDMAIMALLVIILLGVAVVLTATALDLPGAAREAGQIIGAVIVGYGLGLSTRR